MFMLQKRERQRVPYRRASEGKNPVDSSSSLDRVCRVAVAAIPFLALTYALIAGLRTVGDPDLGWQLATGKWIVQHRAIPLTDILSYTARGQEWIYPVLSQAAFYCLYVLGGYSLLSWLGASACVGTIALQIRRGSLSSQVLAIIAVPLIASRTSIRAEVFTTVLFAAFVSVLWNYHRSGVGPLWTLPPLMALWVNLHLGYVSGLGMCAAYVFLELGDAVSSDRRPAAIQRLRRAIPWLLATFLATLLNPWGVRDYVGMARLVPVHSSRWIVELMSVPLTPSKIGEAFAWRDPKSAIWWMVLAVILALFVSIVQRRFAPAIIFCASLYLVAHAVRFEGPFATVAVIIGGSVLADGVESLRARVWPRLETALGGLRKEAVALALVIVLTAFTGARAWDLVTNRQYFRTAFQSSFGPGESWWYPEDAAAFIKRERLPGNVFNDYTSGGFLAWRLLPEYPNYIDGRGSPFGDKVFFSSLALQQRSLDSSDWQKEADARGINTVFVNLDRDVGVGLYKIDEFCRSKTWRPVYMDPKAAIFVRVRPETADLISRLQIDCDRIAFDGPITTGLQSKSYQFNYYLNTSAILVTLGRDSEALHNLNLAEAISSENGYLHYVKGVLLLRSGETDGGERELRRSLQLSPSDVTALAMVALYRRQGKNAEAIDVLRHQAEVSPQPYELYFEIGSIQLEMQRPEDALRSFDLAAKDNAFLGEAEDLGRGFNAQLAAERARAYRRLGNLEQAISSQRTSLQFGPDDRGAWLQLAELCESAGQSAEASKARAKAASLAEEQAH